MQEQTEGRHRGDWQDRTKLNQQLIDIAARVRDIETKIAETEARLLPLDAREQADPRLARIRARSRSSKCSRPCSASAAAPPPALLVRPEDALQSLRTAMLLGAVVPEMRARAEKLAGDLGELVGLRKTIAAERDRLAADRDSLNADQTAAGDAGRRTPDGSKAASRKIMDVERAARDRRCRARSTRCKDLIAKMEQDLKSAAKAAATASRQGAPAR